VLTLTQAEGSEEWNLQVKSVVPCEETDGGCGGSCHVGCAGGGSTEGPVYAADEVPPPYQPVEPPAPAMNGNFGNVAYTVRLDTTAGVIDIIVRPDWAPQGTRRFLELAAAGDLAELSVYRAIKGCIVQFGLPAKRVWPPIPDDPPTGVPFLLGAVSFAAIGENTRRSTLFICIGDMSHMLGQKSWETPIGAVAEASLEVLESINTMYGDIAEFGGPGPDTGRINAEGNSYLRAEYPRLTYIRSARPLDWQPSEDVGRLPALEAPAAGEQYNQPPSWPHQQQHQPQQQQLQQQPEHFDQASMAALAAKEAQQQALRASEAAQRAAQAQDAASAAEAARLAHEAAKSAQASADAAEAARLAMQAGLARAQAAAAVASAAPVPAMQQVAAASQPAAYVGGSGAAYMGGSADFLAASARFATSQIDQGEPVDVPVEVRRRGRPTTAPMHQATAIGRTGSYTNPPMSAPTVPTAAPIHRGAPHHLGGAASVQMGTSAQFSSLPGFPTAPAPLPQLAGPHVQSQLSPSLSAPMAYGYNR